MLNTSYFLCPSCDTPHFIFGSPDHFHRAATDVNVPVLGELPLVPDVNKGGDTGIPFVLSSQDKNLDKAEKEWKDAMFTIASKVFESISGS